MDDSKSNEVRFYLWVKLNVRGIPNFWRHPYPLTITKQSHLKVLPQNGQPPQSLRGVRRSFLSEVLWSSRVHDPNLMPHTGIKTFGKATFLQRICLNQLFIVSQRVKIMHFTFVDSNWAGGWKLTPKMVPLFKKCSNLDCLGSSLCHWPPLATTQSEFYTRKRHLHHGIALLRQKVPVVLQASA